MYIYIYIYICICIYIYIYIHTCIDVDRVLGHLEGPHRAAQAALDLYCTLLYCTVLLPTIRYSKYNINSYLISIIVFDIYICSWTIAPLDEKQKMASVCDRKRPAM